MIPSLLAAGVVSVLHTGLATAQAQEPPEPPEGLVVDTRLDDMGFGGYRVAVTRDGWILVGHLPAGAPESAPHLIGKAFLAPDEVERWTTEADAALRDPLGFEATSGRTAALGPTPGLRVALTTFRDQDGGLRWVLRWRGCRARLGWTVTAGEAGQFVGALRSAVARARRQSGGRPPLAPSNASVFWEHAVGCAAAPLDTLTFPVHPLASPEGTVVGVSLVVDTAGLVDPGSLYLLADAPPELLEAVRRHVTGWRFTRPSRGGTLVRERMHKVLLVRRSEAAEAGGTPEAPDVAPVLLGPGAEPWVRFRDVLGDRRLPAYLAGRLPKPKYAFVPAAEAQAWASTALALLADDSLDLADVPNATVDLGAAPEPIIRYWRYDGTLTRIPCWGHLISNGWKLAGETARAVADAAAAALAGSGDRVALPPEPAQPHTPTCSARPAQPLVLRGDPNGASTELFATAVVGADGRIDAETLHASPAADPDAVAELRDSLAVWRFHPAQTARQRVAQLSFLEILTDPSDQPSADTPIVTCLVGSPSGSGVLISGAGDSGAWRPWARGLAAAMRSVAEPSDRTAWAWVDVVPRAGEPPSISVRIFGADPDRSTEAQIGRLVQAGLSVAGDPPGSLTVHFQGPCA